MAVIGLDCSRECGEHGFTVHEIIEKDGHVFYVCRLCKEIRNHPYSHLVLVSQLELVDLEQRPELP